MWHFRQALNAAVCVMRRCCRLGGLYSVLRLSGGCSRALLRVTTRNTLSLRGAARIISVSFQFFPRRQQAWHLWNFEKEKAECVWKLFLIDVFFYVTDGINPERRRQVDFTHGGSGAETFCWTVIFVSSWDGFCSLSPTGNLMMRLFPGVCDLPGANRAGKNVTGSLNLLERDHRRWTFSVLLAGALVNDWQQRLSWRTVHLVGQTGFTVRSSACFVLIIKRLEVALFLSVGAEWTSGSDLFSRSFSFFPGIRDGLLNQKKLICFYFLCFIDSKLISLKQLNTYVLNGIHGEASAMQPGVPEAPHAASVAAVPASWSDVRSL